MIDSFASGATFSLVAKNETKNTFKTSQFSVVIMRYL